MLLLVISLFLFFNYSKKKILDEKERNHQQKMTFQKEMLSSTVNTQENERSRIARELHDDISSKLNVINMNLNMLRLKIEGQDQQKMMEDIGSSLNVAIERTRSISHELMPPMIAKFPLSDALVDLSGQINRSEILNMEIQGAENLKDVEGLEKLHIFRIIQELCNNTMKHANATRIDLDIDSGNSHLTFMYSDDGKGFPKSEYRKGMGMLNIESRLQVLHGFMDVLPSEKGVKIKLTIPYA